MDVLICAVSQVHPDNSIDDRVSYKRGMPLGTFPTGHNYGTQELIPPISGGEFVRIHITRNDGTTPVWEIGTDFVNLSSSIQDITNRFTDMETSDVDFDNDGIPLNIRKRQWQILLDTLPAGVVQTLNQTGEYTVTWPTLRSFFLDLKNGTTAEDQEIDLG